MRVVVVFLSAVLMLPGCASIMSGTTQTISINSNPTGADCQFERDGSIIASFRTPNGVVVEKTKHDIEVSCSLAGYHDSTAVISSDIEGATFANIILGGGIGWAIDSASGADNKYAESVTVTMVPETSPAPVQVAPESENTSELPRPTGGGISPMSELATDLEQPSA